MLPNLFWQHLIFAFINAYTLRDNASVWKLYNFDDFTGSEIIIKPKVYVVLQYMRQMSHALNLEDHKRIQKDGAVKTNVSVF